MVDQVDLFLALLLLCDTVKLQQVEDSWPEQSIVGCLLWQITTKQQGIEVHTDTLILIIGFVAVLTMNMKKLPA